MNDIVLTQGQQKVLDSIKTFIESDASVFILHGYAGTGKTTMVKQIADFVSEKRDVALMAPTGRAARVLHEKTGYDATTIHKAIYGSKAICSNEAKDLADTEFKLKFEIKVSNGNVVAIVDESSMLCSHTMDHELFVFGTNNLMDDLLSYVRPSFGGKVIFVGDPAQLPPVGESVSQALVPGFFEAKGLKVMKTELTEVLRQNGESVILKNAMNIRGLLASETRNRLMFEERQDDVMSILPEQILPLYLETCRENGKADSSVVVTFSNATASHYNRDIRRMLYNEDEPPLRRGDVLMVVQNNYMTDRMNGEFLPVLDVGSEVVKQSAAVYVQEGGEKVRKTITLSFVHVVIPDGMGEPTDCMLSLDLLNNDQKSLTIDEQRALYINFCMRHSELKQGSEAFSEALQNDAYFNCLKAKYGYAVTGHKCQGGEWEKVFVDFTGRTGLDNACLRWAYTATTRASKTLYFTNLPHITPFTKFRIEPVQKVASLKEECRVLVDVEKSPFHADEASDFLHAKWMCINKNMQYTPYSVQNVRSFNYQEEYFIQTPDGIEQYTLRYKKGGLFANAVAKVPTCHTSMVCMMLNDERAMPVRLDYKPSDKIHEELFFFVRSACDELSIQITNIVEYIANHYVMYYFRTCNTYSCIMAYIDAKGFVTYAKPMSMAGTDDSELATLIEYITRRFE